MSQYEMLGDNLDYKEEYEMLEGILSPKFKSLKAKDIEKFKRTCYTENESMNELDNIIEEVGLCIECECKAKCIEELQ